MQAFIGCNLSSFIFYVVLPIGFNTSQLVVDEGVGMVTVCVVTGSEFRNQMSLELFAELESRNTNATGMRVRMYVCACTYVCMSVVCVCVCVFGMCLCACSFDHCVGMYSVYSTVRRCMSVYST